eukprot:scaffold36596_cov52-Phaeocystis_antarctica.AAC.1
MSYLVRGRVQVKVRVRVGVRVTMSYLFRVRVELKLRVRVRVRVKTTMAHRAATSARVSSRSSAARALAGCRSVCMRCASATRSPD